MVNLLAFNVGVEIGQLLALGATFIFMGYWRSNASFKLKALYVNVMMMINRKIEIAGEVSGLLQCILVRSKFDI